MKHHRLFSTYSIVARDPETGQLGVAVQTHQMCVGHAVPWVQPGVGAVATQASTNIGFGPLGLALLAAGVPAPQVIAALVASDEKASRRQVAAVDAQGRAAAWTGDLTIPEAAHHVGEGYSVQANMMTNSTVVAAMAAAFEDAQGDLAQRMLAALQAAQAEGGDIRGMQSAALLVTPGGAGHHPWERDYDLRVDEHERPVEELARLVRLRHAQLTAGKAYDQLKQNPEETKRIWAEARQEAPELEEEAFWQGMTLADELGDFDAGVAIMREMLATDPRREHWVELLRRLKACRFYEHEDTADRLLAALE